MNQAPTHQIPDLFIKSTPTLVLFSMQDCAPCQATKGVLQEIEADFPEWSFVETKYIGGDVMGRSAMLRRGVKLYPTVVLIDKEAELARATGQDIPSASDAMKSFLSDFLRTNSRED